MEDDYSCIARQRSNEVMFLSEAYWSIQSFLFFCCVHDTICFDDTIWGRTIG
jgi:hypothetical protein|eukprot:COSAG01_NODE_3095_length_6592_cov_88.338980_3_plen_52_part_00